MSDPEVLIPIVIGVVGLLVGIVSIIIALWTGRWSVIGSRANQEAFTLTRQEIERQIENDQYTRGMDDDARKESLRQREVESRINSAKLFIPNQSRFLGSTMLTLRKYDPFFKYNRDLRIETELKFHKTYWQIPIEKFRGTALLNFNYADALGEHVILLPMAVKTRRYIVPSALPPRWVHMVDFVAGTGS